MKQLAVKIAVAQRRQMEELLRARLIPQGIARRIQSVLLLSKGSSLRQIREGTGLNLRHIVKWRERFGSGGVEALADRPRPGRPKRVSSKLQTRIISDTLRRRPPGCRSHWTSRLMARRHQVSFDTVQKIWRAAGLKPHRQGTYLASNDPHFSTKAKRVIGLYLQPPQEAAVFCVDEKSAIQALDRVQPLLPLRAGAPERRGFEYLRHGTCSLYAALEVATGKVIGRCRKRHRSIELCQFLSTVIKGRKEKQIHIILDNLSAHKTKVVQTWLKAHPGVHLHYTPTYSSWLNQVETWFGMITSQCIRRGTFTSVRDLIRRIDSYIHSYNQHATPFTWTYRETRKRIRVPLSYLSRH
jgi:transposase